jgi:hypothetical protein
MNILLTTALGAFAFSFTAPAIAATNASFEYKVDSSTNTEVAYIWGTGRRAGCIDIQCSNKFPRRH